MATTYKLQAEFMAEKLGVDRALEIAREFQRNGIRDTREFWRYVVWNLENIKVVQAYRET
jgi:hypothetical protein